MTGGAGRASAACPACDVSVVIPTFNRRRILGEVLQALDDQQGAPPFEIVVVDDGSTDGTFDWLGERATAHPVRRLRQQNRGPAAARNRGVAAAAGAIVAFLGDDTVPEPGWLAAHWAEHQASPGAARLAVIGYTAWHPRLRRTPFLEFINEQGPQFGYALIGDSRNVPFNFFYTSNLSLPRDLLLEEPFDESFPDPAWEDIEAAFRLFRRGLRLVYEPRARVLHDHPTDFRRFCARQERAGYSAVIFARKHPELAGFLGLGPEGPGPLPSRLHRFRRECLVRALQFLPVSLPGMWEEALRVHYLRGLHRAWREGPFAMERVGS
ncbi:MAG: glycosyltransferase [Thermoanaerobaculia bacterium]|nr:glycosyltransferase [Thermoanaerobaculia bacterium]MBP9143263.1 glycosyltransferase [Thermoanaerobaculia bacterium]